MLIPQGARLVRLNQDGTPVNPNYAEEDDLAPPAEYYMTELKKRLIDIQNLLDELDTHLANE